METHAADQSEPRDIPGNPATVTQVIVVDPTDGKTTVYDGEFPFRRDGGAFEVDMPVETVAVTYGDTSDDDAPTVHESAFVGDPPAIDAPSGTEPIIHGDPIVSGPLPDRPIETLPDGEGSLLDSPPEHLLVVPRAMQVASGRITAVELLDDHVGVRVDDPMAAAPEDVTLSE